MCVIFLNFIASVILRMKIIYFQEIYILKFEYLIVIKLKNTTTVENSPIQSKIVDRGDIPNTQLHDRHTAWHGTDTNKKKWRPLKIKFKIAECVQTNNGKSLVLEQCLLKSWWSTWLIEERGIPKKSQLLYK